MARTAHRDRSDTSPAQRILRLGNAFWEAQALLTAVELDLFTVLRAGPASEAGIRAMLGVSGRGLGDLLRLLVTLGVLDERDGGYRNGADAAACLVKDEPGYVGGSLLGAKANLYEVAAGLTETMRSGKPLVPASGFTEMLADADELRRYAEMMGGTLRPLIPQLRDAIAATLHGMTCRDGLDVGGCRGDLATGFASAHPDVAWGVFDLPQLRPVFDEYVAEQSSEEAAGRVAFHGGDFFTDPLPATDLVIMGHVLHNWSRDQRAALVNAAFRALRPGGVLFVFDRMLVGDRLGADNLVASLIMALVTEDGAEYPLDELDDLARSAGFGAVDHRPLGENETLARCHKPFLISDQE